MEGEIGQRAVKGRCVIGSFVGIMRRKTVSMEEKRVEEQYSPANTDIWIRDLDMEYYTAVKSAWCGNKLSESSMWRDKIIE